MPGAQAREDGASADQQPAAQEPAPQQPAPEPKPPAGTPAPAEAPRLKLPPPPPKVVDVRMPGEAGYFVGISGWLPSGQIWSDKGHAAAFLDPSKLELPGKAKPALGAEVGIAVGLHNSIRVSYFNFRRSGTTTAPHELVIFDQTYSSGNELATTAKVSNYKISYEYLTWPYPVEARHFRLKTLWQMHYVNVRSDFDAPIRSSTPDSAGNYTSYATKGSKGYFSPAVGLGLHEYVSRNFRIEANLSGFSLPHRFRLVDSDASIAYRLGSIELRAGGKAFLFRSSPKSDYFFRGTVGGAFVGIRWYSN